MTLAPGDPRHGTNNGYKNHGCRCDACRVAGVAYSYARLKEWRRRQGVVPRADYLAAATKPHGVGAYQTGRCRCDECTAAASAARQARRLADPEAARAYDREYKRRYRARLSTSESGGDQ